MDKAQHIYCILGADMLLIDFTAAVTPFLFAMQYGVDLKFHFISPSAQLPLMPGLKNSPSINGIERMPSAIGKDDIVMIFGANNTETALNSPISNEIIEWLKTVPHKQQTYISVCVGALLLAKAGILKDKFCTTFYSRLGLLEQLSPSAKICHNQIFVHDDNVFTSAGITTGVDLALYFIELRWGAELTYKIAREMVVYNRRQSKDAQLSPYLMNRNHVHSKVHKAQDLICHAPQTHWTAEIIAAQINISTRQLNRKFSEVTHTSLAKYIQNIRMGYAKQLMQIKSKSIENIAHESGIGTTRSLRRLWQEYYKQSPKQWRSENI